jgi:predicted signal transduction protein with EAL and GGDEF domain
MDALIKHADIAMYVAKAEGRNRYMLYSADADTPVEALQFIMDPGNKTTLHA